MEYIGIICILSKLKKTQYMYHYLNLNLLKNTPQEKDMFLNYQLLAEKIGKRLKTELKKELTN